MTQRCRVDVDSRRFEEETRLRVIQTGIPAKSPRTADEPFKQPTDHHTPSSDAAWCLVNHRTSNDVNVTFLASASDLVA